MTLKVLQLISGGDTGGAKTHIFSLMKGLQKFVDAKIICFIKDSFYEDALKENINIEVIEQKRRSDFSVADKIAKIVKEENYDIVHCHGARANTVAIFLRKKINVPMLTTIHSDYLLDFKDNFYKNLIFTPINKFALKKFKYYIAITENFKKMLISRGFAKDGIYTMYNGLDFSVEERKISKEKFLLRYNIDFKDKFIVGQAARLDRVKNVKMMINVANECLKTEKDLLFLIAGDGEEREMLEDYVRKLNLGENVKFLGYVKDNFSFFNAIDINILSSLSESFPYVILEAAMMKKPTIATCVGGIPEMIEDEVDGFLVDSNDYEEMAKRVLRIKNDSALRIKMGDAIQKKVKEKFSESAMANTQYRIYEDILRRENENHR